jgi:glycerol-3-phosphate cytidylyltransferase-like family protein
MSVSLLITSIDDEVVNKLVHVANQNAYTTIWVPISSKHKLVILAHGEDGHNYDESALEDFIEDVTQFISIARFPGNIPQEYQEYIEKRSTRLLEELEKLRGHRVKFSLG